MNIFNIALIVIILIVTIVAIVIYLRPDPLAGDLEEEEVDRFDPVYLTNEVKDEFNRFVKLNIADLDLNKVQSDKIENDKKHLNRALRTCYLGDATSKAYVQQFIKQVLVKTFGISEENIDNTIKFGSVDLSIRDKFDIILYIYKEKFGIGGLKKFLDVMGYLEPYGEGSMVYYKVTTEDINLAFNRHALLIDALSFEDKLNILTERIFADYLGLGVVDEIRDMDIDGVNCGTSGLPYRENRNYDDYYSEDTGENPMSSYNAVWVTCSGKLIWFAFLGFEQENSFERVCKRIYKYDNPGTLSADRGHIVNDMADGSRIVVVRPPEAESWGFFCRKLNVGSKMSFEDLMPYENADKLKELIRWIVLGSANIIITGEQGCGKSTFMMSIIQFIRPSYAIRIQEMAFELNLRTIYPERNIMSLRQTDTVSGQEGLNIQKKMDGSCNLLGEVADQETTLWAIQICQTGSNMLMATHHANSTPDLLKAFADYSNDRSKLELAAASLNFDIHLNRDAQGRRFVERITAICPHIAEPYSTDVEEAQKQYYFRQTDRQVFDTIDLLKWNDGGFEFTGCMDDRNRNKILKSLTIEEREEFNDFCSRVRKEVGA